MEWQGWLEAVMSDFFEYFGQGKFRGKSGNF